MRTQVEDALLDLRAEFSPLTYLRLRGDSQAPGNAPAEEVPLEAACERHGIAFVPFFPLAVGSLGELEVLTQPAQRLGISTSAVALAWLLRRSPVMIPIPGTKSLAHLADNIGAAEVAPQLTDEEVRALTAVEDEESATLSEMSIQMVSALGRRRLRPTS